MRGCQNKIVFKEVETLRYNLNLKAKIKSCVNELRKSKSGKMDMFVTCEFACEFVLASTTAACSAMRKGKSKSGRKEESQC